MHAQKHRRYRLQQAAHTPATVLLAPAVSFIKLTIKLWNQFLLPRKMC
jgi:hypothetical protein